MTSTHKNSLRAEHAPGFTIEEKAKSTVIHYRGKVFAQIRRAPGLPKGFTERAVIHFFEMLDGTRTALWDEQAVFGEYPRNAEETKRRAGLQADENLRRLDAGATGAAIRGTAAK